MSRPKTPDEFRPEESPIAWFGEMLLAIDRGDFSRAPESQRQLDRLGWRVNRRRLNNSRRQAPQPEEVAR
jgi:hypothetical protein